MKSQKGITMMSLVIYVVSFLAITVLIGTITTFFYKNISVIDTGISTSVDYNRFNTYMLNEAKRIDIINVYSDRPGVTEPFITFEYEDGSIVTFVKKGKNLYYCKTPKSTHPDEYEAVKICENIDEDGFRVVAGEDSDKGKRTIRVLLKLSGQSFSTEYVVGG